MVEGPGATRNGRKLQLVVGSKVTHIEHTTPSFNSTDNKQKLDGRRLDQVFSVGKEVFLLLISESDQDEIALRLHFGMNGSLWVHETQQEGAVKTNRNTSSHRRHRNQNTPASLLTITFEKDPGESFIVTIQDSTVNIVSSTIARSKLERLKNRDVCGPFFNAQDVVDALVAYRPTAMISDAILDQERFPGVGNIIKMEGLHRSKIHPKQIVSTLSAENLLSLVKNCRDFSMSWLSSGRAPKKEVYNQTICETCRDPTVRMAKLGKDLSRVTFWCTSCQPLLDHENQPPSSSLVSSTTIPSSSPASNNFANSYQMHQNEQRTLNGCPQHGSSALVLRRVRKMDSANRNRLFRACRVGSCPFFTWADSHFPSCRCNQVSSLRVSKTETTGGRWFLSCRQRSATTNKNQRKHSAKTRRDNGVVFQEASATGGCNFFAWAEPVHLKALGKCLTPLL